MPVFIATRNCTAGVKYVSQFITLVVGVTRISAVLVSTEWMDKTGEVTWGIEASYDNGSTWVTMGGSTATIAELNKGIYMPSLGISNMDKVGDVLWRAFLISTVNITLGMSGEFDTWPSLL